MLSRSLFLLVFLVSPCLGCDSSEGSAAGTSQSGATKQAAAETLSDEARFDKDIRKKSCELLPPAMVANTFGVPEGELQQTSVMGCFYSWDGDGRRITAQIIAPRAHKSEKAAARWFANATKAVSKAELDAQFEKVKQKAKERAGFDSKTKEKAADVLMDSSAFAPEGITFTSVDGVGEDAAIASNDGTIKVRVDNLTFTVGAYAGPPAPEPDYSGLDLKSRAAVAKKADVEWLAKTYPQRKTEGAKLARAIVEAL